MRSSPLALDASRLLPCLRPSFDVPTLLGHANRGPSTNPAAFASRTFARSVCSIRSLTVTSRPRRTPARPAEGPKHDCDRPRYPRPRRHDHDHKFEAWGPERFTPEPTPEPTQENTAQGKDKWATVADLVKPGEYGLHELPHASVPVIYEALHHLRRVPGQGAKIRKMVKYLAASCGEKANPALYDALLVANWDAARGRAHEVWLIMNEMRNSRMDIPPRLFHSALEALAIHPDHINRSVILRQMSQLWELSPEGHCSVLLGMLREGQYEMAAEKMDELIRDGVSFPRWLYDVYMYVFGMRGFLDEALELLHRRIEQRRSPDFADEDNEVPGKRPKRDKSPAALTRGPGHANNHPVSLNLWFFLLDECSRALHYQGTKYIWSRMVVRSDQGEGAGLLDPPDGVIFAVLHTASRAGDPRLATEAIQHLSLRGVRLSTHHYEPLIECYALGGELESALRVLCIMHDAGVPVHTPSTRAVLQIMLPPPPGGGESPPSQNARNTASEKAPPPTPAIDEAIQLLFKLRREHDPRGLPIAALDVVLEALCETGQLARAVDLYRHVRELCPSSGPTANTFSMLLSSCDHADAATFIAAEMAAFSVRPNRVGYDAMVRSHATDGDLNVALQYLMEMAALWPVSTPATPAQGNGGSAPARAAEAQTKQPSPAQRWLTRDTFLKLLERCLREEDVRVWDVVNEANKRGLDVDEDVKAIMGALGMQEPPQALPPRSDEGNTMCSS